MLLDTGYTISIANHDLPPSESLLQTFDNLQSLNIAIDDVFRRIAVRISEERNTITDISNRIEAASKKINSIGSNPSKVCTLFSSAKFPTTQKKTQGGMILSPPKPIITDFDASLLGPIKLPKHVISREMRATRPQHVDTNPLFYELSQAAVNRHEHSATIDKDKESEGTEGLGRLPHNITSVSSVLLFNSDINPYKKYASFNNLEGVSGVDRHKSSLDLFSAPKTIAEGTELPAFTGLQLDYHPELGSVPTFALPDMLPLSHVANISFGGNFASIAPSTGTLALPTLSFDGLPPAGPSTRGKAVVSGVPSNYRDEHSDVSTIPTSVPVSATIPVPTSVPPTSVPVSVPTSVPTQIVPTSVPVTTIPTQPATSGGEPTPAQPTAVVTTASEPAQPKLPTIPAGRNGLLDAIKKGVSLKSAEVAEPVKSNLSKPKTEENTMDLMSALKAGLNRRVAIMSGKDLESEPKPKPSPTSSLSMNLESKIQSRLQQLPKDTSDNEDSGDNWD